jgi:hypothetical protein
MRAILIVWKAENPLDVPILVQSIIVSERFIKYLGFFNAALRPSDGTD